MARSGGESRGGMVNVFTACVEEQVSAKREDEKRTSVRRGQEREWLRAVTEAFEVAGCSG